MDVLAAGPAIVAVLFTLMAVVFVILVIVALVKLVRQKMQRRAALALEEKELAEVVKKKQMEIPPSVAASPSPALLDDDFLDDLADFFEDD